MGWEDRKRTSGLRAMSRYWRMVAGSLRTWASWGLFCITFKNRGKKTKNNNKNSETNNKTDESQQNEETTKNRRKIKQKTKNITWEEKSIKRIKIKTSQTEETTTKRTTKRKPQRGKGGTVWRGGVVSPIPPCAHFPYVHTQVYVRKVWYLDDAQRQNPTYSGRGVVSRGDVGRWASRYYWKVIY